MRKGEEKRQELLNVAEKLFCRKGYEATSVQDILDDMHLSKGGFYHHFASKEEVLKALCDRRAERAAAFTDNALASSVQPIDRINTVLHGFMPLRMEETAFVRMLLPLIAKPEGRAIAMAYQDALCVHFLPLLKKEVASAAAAEVVYPPVKDMEDVILHTVNHCWMEVLISLSGGERPEQAVLLQVIGKYRRAVELLLDAPYGSMEILRVEEITEALWKVAV